MKQIEAKLSQVLKTVKSNQDNFIEILKLYFRKKNKILNPIRYRNDILQATRF